MGKENIYKEPRFVLFGECKKTQNKVLHFLKVFGFEEVTVFDQEKDLFDLVSKKEIDIFIFDYENQEYVLELFKKINNICKRNFIIIVLIKNDTINEPILASKDRVFFIKKEPYLDLNAIKKIIK